MFKHKYFQREVQGPDQSGALAVRQVGHARVPRCVLASSIKTRYVGIMWCIKGGYQDETEGEGITTGQAGDFGVVFPDRTILSMRALKDGTELRYLEFDGADAVRECFAAGLWEGAFHDPAPPCDMLDDIAANLRKGKPTHLSAAAGLLRELLFVCGDHARQAASDKAMHNARRLIHAHFRDPSFNMQALQAELDISRTSLNVRFKADTGTSPHAYLLKLRVREACHLLRGTERPVAEVGRACGFADPVHFSQVIHAHTGRAPRDYRKCNAGAISAAR